MRSPHPLGGVYAAALTPLKTDFSIDPPGMPALLEFLCGRGCHGALLFGTTGEGPSFSPAERLEVLRAALDFRQAHPDFHLLIGTGTPSLQETIELTRATIELGADGVLVLPPYYYRKVNEDGLFAWFSQVLQHAVPAGSALFGYHIPPVTGVPLSSELIGRLKAAFPGCFAGIKDSSADLEVARDLGGRFGADLLIFNGTDRLFSQALKAGARGCITALGNLFSPDLRRVWDAHQRGEPDEAAQVRLNGARTVSESYPPAPALLKMLLNRWHGFPLWPVRPPLLSMPYDIAEKAAAEIEPYRNA